MLSLAAPAAAEEVEGLVAPDALMCNPNSDPQQRTEIIEYVVRAGDTVYDLAERFGVAPETIIGANAALAGRPDRLQVGQVLQILPLDGVYYTIRSGDTLSGLSQRFGVSVDVIVDCPLNRLPDAESLKIGQTVVIPGATAAPAAPVRTVARVAAPADAVTGSGSFAWPLQGVISQRYRAGHRALDISAPKGTTVRAADDGFVVQTAWEDNGYGHCIIIDHGDGVRTRYAHLSAFLVSAGDSVSQGQPIGEVGTSGWATGPHLHFEIIINGTQQDPLTLLPR
ncbi:MAG: M23 family metallopeptidase [Chloroflexi bacterium]|nr:M23 family metallopeptidase [Chloroflexota bacterium]